jgi:hypothetical protein
LTQPARNRGTTRRSWLLAGLTIPLFRLRAATSFKVTYDGDNLYPVATGLHFLTPKVVNRLRDSADTQAFISQLTIFDAERGTREKPPAHARLIVSCSPWAETIHIVIPGTGSQDVLSAAQAESWFLDTLFISTSGLDPTKKYRVQFEMRSRIQSGSDLSHLLDLNFSLASMIDMFSHKTSGDEQIWNVGTTFVLKELPRLVGRVARHG